MKNPTMEGKLQRFNLDERARGSLGVKKGLIVSKEDDLDLKETDEATHNSNKNVQPEEGRLRPHCNNF